MHRYLRYIQILLFISISSVIHGQHNSQDSLLLLSHQLDSIAEYNSEMGNDSIAIELCRQGLLIRETILGESNPLYAKSLSHLSKYLFEQGQYYEAEELVTKAINVQKTALGERNDDYAESILILADIQSSLGNYQKAIMLANEALTKKKELYGSESVEYATTLQYLASFYLESEDISESMELYNIALDIYNSSEDFFNSDYANLLLGIAKCKSLLGDDNSAIEFGLKAAVLFKNIYGINHPSYATSMTCVSSFYSYIGNYQEAYRIDSEMLNIYESCYGKYHPYYLTLLLNIAEDNYALEKYDESISIANVVADICKSSVNDSLIYIESLEKISKYYLANKDYKKALQKAKESYNLIRDLYGTNHIKLSSSLGIIANCYTELDNAVEALKFGSEALNILKVEKPNSIVYANLLDELSHICAKNGIFYDSYKYETKALDLYRNYMIKNYSVFSTIDRANLWNSMKDKFLFYPGLAYRAFSTYCTQSPEIISSVYDYSALFARGILLYTEMEMKKLIAESNDSILTKKYNELHANLTKYNSAIEMSQEERGINTDSLNLIIQEQKNELDSTYSDFTQRLDIVWSDIKRNLNKNDIAIEFLSFPILNDSVMYVALTLRNDSEAPRMTVLFEEKQLKEISDTIYYYNRDITDLIWAPLLSQLKDVKNIYFAPSGALHNIGIEYLPGMEDYKMYRLSSTRELVLRNETHVDNRAVLYGNLDYDTGVDTLSRSKSVTILDETFVKHADVRSLGLRGGKEKLKHTKDEIEQIERELNQAQWICVIDSASLGTEESFKALAGRKVGLLHVATHGFYYTSEEAEDLKYKFMLLDNNIITTEDKSLTRSGLVLSGANLILEDNELPDNVEDGILTANEIANVDLRGLDLVVLSACQTGLGDISQGEGVFGLQRGFKKAGAKTILMSLWEVDDKATQILMTQFYRNLLSGQSKRQSLQSAQQYLKEYEGGKYKEPKYWAAFILLDAID